MAKKYKWMERDLEFVNHMGHDPKRIAIFKKQYEERGWCEAELWNIDHQFAKWIVPRLELFISHYASTPCGFTEKEWKKILNKMLDGFSHMASDDYYGFDKKKDALADEALELFGKYARHLWN